MPSSQLLTFYKYTRPLWLNACLLLPVVVATAAGIALGNGDRLDGVPPFIVSSTIALVVGLVINAVACRNALRRQERALAAAYAVVLLLIVGIVGVYILEVAALNR